MEESIIYHIWFATKRRKWLLQGDVEQAILGNLRRIASEKGISLLECGTAVDHVHMLIRTRPDQLPEDIRMLKGGSSYRIFRQFPELKLDARTIGFWQARYAAKAISEDTIPEVTRYIRTQDTRLEKFERG